MRSFAASFIPALALTATMSATMPALAQQPAPPTHGHHADEAGLRRPSGPGKSS